MNARSRALGAHLNLAVIGVALFAAVGALERAALPWYRVERDIRERRE